jgi:AcrR family transcriptional regulator
MISKKVFTRELKRLTILQAAKSLFVEKKYSTVTMDEIAKRAGITKRTLYSYFPSKLSLFIYMFDDNLQHLHRLLVKGARQDLPTVELLKSLFDILYKFTKKNEKFMRLYWTLDSDEFDGLIPEELTQKIKVWTKAMFEEIIVITEQGQRKGVVLDYKPELLAHLMSALNKGIFIHTNKESKFSVADINPDELYQVAVNMMTKGLFKTAAKGTSVLGKNKDL